MKFSHSVQLNSVPEWSSHYINYSNLKKLIYALEKSANRTSIAGGDAESSPLVDNGERDFDWEFRRALDTELEKISTFYRMKEQEIYGELQELLADGDNYMTESQDTKHGDAFDSSKVQPQTRPRRRSSVFQSLGFSGRPRRSSTLSTSGYDFDAERDSDEDEDDERAALNRPYPRRATVAAGAAVDGVSEIDGQRRRPSTSHDDFQDQMLSALYSSGITLKKRCISLYVHLCELKSFVQLNKTGFSKALKKYDKTLDRGLKQKYLERQVTPAYPFQEDTTRRLTESIEKVEKLYADVVTKGDVSIAKRELRLHLREYVVWERNTVWREMIGIERKAQAANLGVRSTLLGDDDPSKSRLQGDEAEHGTSKELVTPMGTYRLPNWLLQPTLYMLIGSLAVFAVILMVPIMETSEQQNCLAMLVFVSLLWATEAIPLFVTSILIPFLCVVLRIMRSDDERHDRLLPAEAARYAFAAMWTPVIWLLLGGFTIAAALSKYQIAKYLATSVLSKAGTKPQIVLLTNMFVAMIASMWISNVAAPVLCYSIIQPLLRILPSDSNFSKALIMGIALASNVGGTASPIASPQNIVALQNMNPDPSWLVWFFIAIPVCVISILLIWLLLLVSFRPERGTRIVSIKPVNDKFSGTQWFISLTTIVTIALWCVSHQLEDVFGDMGVIAILPMVLFFGTGVLTKEDFNNFLWTIIILAAGGLSLGKAVASSGLLETITQSIGAGVQGMGTYGVFVVFAFLILVVATFISHTVAALIILPIVAQVGANMADPHPNLLVMAGALMCSAAMGLPTSGFPNMTAIMMEDSHTGKRYLRVRHFISRGIPSSIIVFAVVASIGYGLMLVANL